MLTSSHNFGQAYITLLSPMSNEADLPERYPNAVQTIEQMSAYQELITDLKDTVQPELDLIDTRIIAPIKEFNEVIKHAKKAITKRDHKVCLFTNICQKKKAQKN
jgi:amphiphysin